MSKAKRGKLWDKMAESIKADAANGRLVNLLVLSVEDMEHIARRLTVAELRNVRFTFMGISFRDFAIDAPTPRSRK